MLTDDVNPLSPEAAQDFVNKVMAPVNVHATFSQRSQSIDDNIELQLQGLSQGSQCSVIDIFSPVPTSKKRLLSGSPESCPETGSKKVRYANESVISVDAFQCLVKSIEELSTSVNTMAVRIEKRMCDIETNVENKLTVKFNSVITTRVRDEVEQVRDDILKVQKQVSGVEKKVLDSDSFHKAVDSKVTKEVQTKLKTFSSVVQSASKDRSRNVVIRNLTESERERTDSRVTLNKVVSLFRDRLNLMNVRVLDVERKEARGKQKHGLVIVQLENQEQKREVMRAKGKLKGMTQFKDIYIDDDLSPEQRVSQQNMNMLVREFGREKNLKVVKGKLVKSRGPGPHSGARQDRGKRDEDRGQRSRPEDRGRRNEDRDQRVRPEGRGSRDRQYGRSASFRDRDNRQGSRSGSAPSRRGGTQSRVRDNDTLSDREARNRDSIDTRSRQSRDSGEKDVRNDSYVYIDREEEDGWRTD